MEILENKVAEVILKNDGSKGIICNYCGGYGFTNNMTGGSNGCIRCNGTGIEPISTHELQRQINDLRTGQQEILDLLRGKQT